MGSRMAMLFMDVMRYVSAYASALDAISILRQENTQAEQAINVWLLHQQLTP